MFALGTKNTFAISKFALSRVFNDGTASASIG
jgi:hypothetical protein